MEAKSLSARFQELKTGPEGLSQKEARTRLLQFGFNSLGTQSRLILLKNLASQFTDFLVILLIVAGFLSWFLGDLRATIAMFSIVFINANIGFWQQYRTERTLSALKTFLPHKSKVLRDGKQKEIYSQFIVPGDVIILQAGDAIPADGQIIESYSLKVNESALTGETTPQGKEPRPLQIHPQTNLVFMGTAVLEGEGKVLVVSTGKKTEFGKIAERTKSTKEELTPLQKKLRRTGQTVALLAMFLMLVIVFYELFKTRIMEGQPIEGGSLRTIFLFGLALAAALVPEGLPATISVALSIGASRLLKKKAVVKKLANVETLGSTDVICTDKTGTLTLGKMKVLKIVLPGGNTPLNFEDFKPRDKFPLIENWTFNNNTQKTEKGLTGDPNEVALYEAVWEKKLTPDVLLKEGKTIYEFSFSPLRKMASALVEKERKLILFSRGAPQTILEKCNLEESQVKLELSQVENLAKEGLRVLAFAHRELPYSFKKTKEASRLEKELVFDGLVGIQDKIRPEVFEAVSWCHQAQIRIAMITGDHGLTAESVAKKIKLSPDGTFRMISGGELEKMGDLELKENLLHPIVFYETSPPLKLRIVNALQEMGQVVAVTGDGVNDAPALKKADIGVAMGITGTDVAKEAADMVLLDDNFATIINAVKEGRVIWDNLKKFLFYIFASNAGEFVTVFGGLIFGLPLTLLAVQILAVDLGTDIFPSLTLALDPPVKGILKRSPSHQKEPLLGKPILLRLLYVGLIMGGGAAFNFWLVADKGAPGTSLYYQATTAAFATLVICQVVNVFAVRGRFATFREALFGNKFILGAVLAEIIILLSVVYWKPLQNILYTKPLSFSNWFTILLVGLIFLLVEEFKKLSSPAQRAQNNTFPSVQ